MYIKNKKGQSTVEYVLLMTAVVAVIIVFVTGTQKGGLQAQLNSTLNSAVQDINSDLLVSSHAATAPSSSPTPTGGSVTVLPGATTTTTAG